MRLFKYVGSHVAEIIRDCRLKVTPPDEFDDPFELCPQLEAFDEAGYLDRIMGLIGEEKFTKHLVSIGVFSDPNEGRGFFSDPAFRLAYAPRLKTKLEGHVAMHQQRAAKEFGIICFTENEEDLRLWASYGKNHEGALFEFDPEKLEQVFGNLMKVEYVDDRPKLNPMIEEEQLPAFIRATIATKGKDWAEQREWRIVRALKDCQTGEGESAGHFFAPIPPEAIRAVTFGTRCNDSTIHETARVISSKGYGVQLKQARKHKTKYGLTYNPMG